jgi:hypothetical protein
MTRQSRPVRRLLALLDPLLGRATGRISNVPLRSRPPGGYRLGPRRGRCDGHLVLAEHPECRGTRYRLLRRKDEGLPHYVQVLRDRGYLYGLHWGPRDIRVRDFGTGKSRIMAAKALGLTFDDVPDLSFADGVNAVRLLLPRVWLDATSVPSGLNRCASIGVSSTRGWVSSRAHPSMMGIPTPPMPFGSSRCGTRHRKRRKLSSTSTPIGSRPNTTGWGSNEQLSSPSTEELRVHPAGALACPRPPAKPPKRYPIPVDTS